MRLILGAGALALTVAFPVAAQSVDSGDQTAAAAIAEKQGADTGTPDKGGVRFVFEGRPSLRFGRVLRVDFRVKLQGDFRGFSPALATDEGLFDPRRRRVGIEGTFLRDFEYQVEREIRPRNSWRDVFVNFRYFRNVQVQAGKFKVPFSREQLTSPMDLDFVYRSLVVNNLSPARDIGVAVHGRFFERGLGYEVGVFRHDGENARFAENPGAGITGVGRLTARPLRLTGAPGAIRDFEVGVNVSVGDVSEGLNSLRGRTAAQQEFFEPVYVNGQRVRFGLDVDWSPGPFSVKGEFIRVRDERLGQGIFAEDLPPLVSRGWFLSGTWAVTGEKKLDGIQPRRPLFRGGAGAAELAVRYERLGFGSFSASEEPFSNPRAANLLHTSNRAWTIGVNWYLNRWAKVQVDGIREWIEDPDRSPILGRRVFWMRVCRLQFVL